MAKLEIRKCQKCNMETLHVWQADWLDNEQGQDPQFYLLCTSCMSIVNTSDLEKDEARMAVNQNLALFTSDKGGNNE